MVTNGIHGERFVVKFRRVAALRLGELRQGCENVVYPEHGGLLDMWKEAVGCIERYSKEI